MKARECHMIWYRRPVDTESTKDCSWLECTVHNWLCYHRFAFSLLASVKVYTLMSSWTTHVRHMWLRLEQDGNTSAKLKQSYKMMFSLSCHDSFHGSETFGTPAPWLSSRPIWLIRYAVAILDHQANERAVLEMPPIESTKLRKHRRLHWCLLLWHHMNLHMLGPLWLLTKTSQIGKCIGKFDTPQHSCSSAFSGMRHSVGRISEHPHAASESPTLFQATSLADL